MSAFGGKADIGRNGTGADTFLPPPSDDVLKVKTDWIASVTGRLGLAAWIPQTLIYAKGGVAWAHDVYDLNQVGPGLKSDLCSPCSQTRAGWTIGGGIEWAFASNWTAFAEFDHYDFGTNRLLTSPCDLSHCGGPPVPDITDTVDVKQRIETVKLGVNYKFNWGGPVVSAY